MYRTDSAGRLPAALLTVLLAVAVAVLPGSGSAMAQPSAAQEIADALRRSPVYVDDGYETALPPARQRELVAQIEDTGLPLYAVVVPLTTGDAFGGDPRQLAGAVHDRLGRDAVILTTGDLPDTLEGWEWPHGKHQAGRAAAAVFHLDEMRDAGLGTRLAKAVEIVAAGNGDEVYEEATADLRTPTPTPTAATPETPGTPEPAGTEAAESSDDAVGTVALIAAAAVALAGLAGLLLVRRRRTARGPAPFTFPRAVFAAAAAADEADLRRRAEAEVITLGEAAQVRPHDADPAGLQHALDAYAAAGTVLDGARGRPDLAGVLALVLEGRDALQGSRTALPLCFFNPLHGRGARRVKWRPLGRRDHLRVSACAACTAAVQARRAPEVLTDRMDGRDVPYFEVPAERSLWAATGYGSLVSDPLAARVARGDFTRALGP
ncbi:hypothetical protein AA958_18385 [Streptomyces sp. CNQ-509]|uniref:hypothetical protein n=1 Tax=unclassified Streptomyces TaxID=2593676 RepID=UPI00062DD633|nr:hypothetical protein [Streptomyces sp. CNQ-509]AKH83849.1 hypothetical protein AA958_18385 [Streptomyces sp. CNQ-509]